MKDEFSLEAKVYDKVWGRHDYDADVNFLNTLFRKFKCKSVIDIGCGTGNHSIKLDKLGYEVTGVDISSSMLKKAKQKDKKAKIKFLQGDMKKIGKIFFNGRKFDAAICLGQVMSSLHSDKDVKVFFKELHKILKMNGLFVFSARNAKQIKEEYLNKLRLDHMINEEKLQLLILTYNTRDLQNPNVIIWRPIYLLNENNKLDFQLREHKLRWFEFSTLKRIATECGFKIRAVYSEAGKEKFTEKKHDDMWFVTTVK
jgi:ubiquinone/menaquinone biosynthesis C-methylase UbiE